MSAPAMEGGAQEEVDDESDLVVYDQRGDPYVGDYVAFASGDTVVHGEVVEGREQDGGALVVVETAQTSERVRLPWSEDIVVNSTDGVECPACGFPSREHYRCEACGHDLAGHGAQVARDGGDA